MMENELEELKELSIAKNKVAYNCSVDLEATHSVLWDKSDKRMKIKIIIILCLIMTQEEIDSATEKLQKYTALRTCEAWIKFT